MVVWAAGRGFVRCHDSSFGANEFNPRSDVSMRFRPFTSRGRTVPTIYGSASIAGALSETLLHLVPVTGGDRRLPHGKLLGHVLSTLAARRDLRLIDLRDPGLPPLGLSRSALIESPVAAYPETARWASSFFHCAALPDGLVWNARQSRDDLAVVLFARGRVERSQLRVVQAPEPLYIGVGLERVSQAAYGLGITVTFS